MIILTYINEIYFPHIENISDPNSIEINRLKKNYKTIMKNICILNNMYYDLLNYQSAMKLSNYLSNPATKFISSSMSMMFSSCVFPAAAGSIAS